MKQTHFFAITLLLIVLGGAALAPFVEASFPSPNPATRQPGQPVAIPDTWMDIGQTVQTQSLVASPTPTPIPTFPSPTPIPNFPTPTPVVTTPPPALSRCEQADLNTDGVVDLADYSFFSKSLFKTNSVADLNKDGLVDVADYQILVSVFGSNCKATSKTPFRIMTIGFNPVFGDTTLADEYFFKGSTKTAASVEEATWANIKQDYEYFTNGLYDIQIAHQLQIKDNYIYPDGFNFTLESFAECVWGRPGFDPVKCDQIKSKFDYVKWAQDYQICQLVDQYQIDEIWMLSIPYITAWENFMIGPSYGFAVNGGAYAVPGCSKQVIVLNPVYNAPHNALHNLGHRIEWTFKHVSDGWKVEDRQFYIEDYLQQFTTYAGVNPGKPYCGNAHYTSNSMKAYEMNNPSVAPNNCADWSNLPNPTGEFVEIDCQAWGCDDRSWQKYWMSRMPHKQESVTLTARVGKQFELPLNYWSFLLYPDEAIKLYHSSR